MNKMKNSLIISILALFILMPSVFAHKRDHFRIHSLSRFDSPIHSSHDDIEVKLKDGSIIFTNYDEDSRVEISEDFELYIDDEKIDLNPEQQKIVKEFYVQFYSIINHAKKIGIEGAKIGISGAMVGLKAVGCVFKLLSPNYDSDDLEREVELAASKLEKRAERLEKKAEKIEDMVDELGDTADEMVKEIPELKELEWF